MLQAVLLAEMTEHAGHGNPTVSPARGGGITLPQLHGPRGLELRLDTRVDELLVVV